jgi:hypothetical protein
MKKFFIVALSVLTPVSAVVFAGCGNKTLPDFAEKSKPIFTLAIAQV